MTEIILAEHQRNTWLVAGEEHVDDLLNNTLPANISIRFIACQSHSEVVALWTENRPDASAAGQPWLIHPKIAERAKGKPKELIVVFGAWSVLLDDDALEVVGRAARLAAEQPEAAIQLVIRAVTAKASAGLAALRCDLVEAALAEAGIGAARVSRRVSEGGAAIPSDDQVEIIVA